MGRPPLPAGQLGSVSYDKRSGSIRARARIRDASGVRHRVSASGATKEEALAKLKQKAWATVNLPAPLDDVRTVQQLLKLWLAEREEFVPTEMLWQYCGSAAIICSYAGSFELREMRPRHAQEVMRRIAAEHPRTTARCAQTVLSEAFNLAVRREVIEVNPMHGILPDALGAEEHDALAAKLEAVLRRTVAPEFLAPE